MDGLPDLTIWRAILITGFAIAVYTGRPPRLIIAVMVSNFGATWYLAADPLAVGVADAASAAVLLWSPNVRNRVIATLFSVMVPFYVSGAAMSLQPSTTYAIIDCIALLQLGVIGGIDRGIGRIRSRLRGWRNHANSLENGHNPGVSVALVSGGNKR